MTDLVYRRVAGGRDPVRDVVLCRDGEPPTTWRSHGPAVGRFSVAQPAADALRAAMTAAAAVPAPAGAADPGGALMEHLDIGGTGLVVPAGADVTGPWGEALAACRVAVDATGDPVAAVALVAEPPGRVRLEHRGTGALELGFGALIAAIRWVEGGVSTTYAEARVIEGVVEAGPGWSRTLDVEPRPATPPAGSPVATASFALLDEGVWIPVRLETS